LSHRPRFPRDERAVFHDAVDEPAPTTGARVLRGGAWMLLSTTLPQVYSLVLSIVAARVLGPDGLGRQSFIAFVELTTIALLTGGMPIALMRFVGETVGRGEPGTARGLFRWAWRIELGASLLGAAILAGAAVAGAEPQAAWVFAAVVVAAGILQTVPAAVLAGLQLWREATIAGLVSGGIGTAASIAVLLLGGGITGMFAVEAAVSLVVMLWTRVLARRGTARLTRAETRPSRELRRSLGRFAGWATAAAVLDLIVWRRFEFFFLAHYSTVAEIAFYSIAFAAVSALIRVPATAASVISPAVANLFGAGAFDRIRSGFGRSVRLVLLVTLPTVAFTLALGPAAVTVFWGDDYDGAGQVLLILAVGSVAVPLDTLGHGALAGLGRARAPLLFYAAAAAVDVVLAFALVPGHGAVGAAVANAAAQLTSGIPMILYAVRAVGSIEWGFGTTTRAAFAAGAGGLAAWTTDLALPEPAGLVVGAIAGLSVFLVVASTVGVILPGDARWLDEAEGFRLRGLVGRLAHRLARRDAQER
jgi:O-antigen/teichoic acid export membrane protein